MLSEKEDKFIFHSDYDTFALAIGIAEVFLDFSSGQPQLNMDFFQALGIYLMRKSCGIYEDTTAMIYAHQIAVARATASNVRAGVFANRK